MRPILTTSATVCEAWNPADDLPTATLDELRVGDSGRVVDVAGDDDVAIRLLEMGLTPGVTVRVIGQAPFGDPVELQLRSYRLSIRRAEAARVTVQ